MRALCSILTLFLFHLAGEMDIQDEGDDKRHGKNDRRNDDTLYLNVLCFGKMAEALKDHLKKGRLIGVQGKIKIDDYQDKDGNPRNSVCVMADEISLGPSNEKTEA